jgi:hypothetical protein
MNLLVFPGFEETPETSPRSDRADRRHRVLSYTLAWTSLDSLGQEVERISLPGNA